MSEEFVPTGGGNQQASAVVGKPSMEALAQQEYAKVLQDSRIAKIMQNTAILHQLLPMTVITNQTEYDQVIDAFDSAKKMIQYTEKCRVEIVGFPTKVIKMINELFKQLKGNVTIAKDHLGALIDAKKKFDKQMIEAGVQAVEDKPLEEGVTKINIEGDLDEKPNNVVSSAKGAKVHTRTGLSVTIMDKVALLKMLVSKNKRYAPFTEALDDIVEINIGPLKKIIKENNRQKLPGLKIEQTSRTV